MILWLDAQLSPYLAPWLATTFSIEARAVRELGLREAKDRAIFEAAGAAGAIVVTKDSDFSLLLERHGPPPQVLWLTLGNTSNAHLKEVFKLRLPHALELLRRGEPLVEISGSLRET